MEKFGKVFGASSVLLGGGLLFTGCLFLIHHFLVIIWPVDTPLNTAEKVVDTRGFSHRVILPKELKSRDRAWDYQATLYENDYPLSRASSREIAAETGKGNMDLSEKSAWISASDNSDPQQNARSYRLRTHWEIPSWGYWLLGGLTGCWLLVVLAMRKWKALGIAVMLAVFAGGAFSLWLSYGVLMEQYEHRPMSFDPLEPRYGTADAPNEDAQAWVDGALSFYFLDKPVNPETFRPTISLCYASLLKIHWSLAFLAKSFIWMFVAGLGYLLIFSSRLVKLLIAFLTAMLVYAGETFLKPLHCESLTVDFFSAVLTILGFFLIASGLYRLRTMWGKLALIGGFLFFGLTCAVRGPHIVGCLAFIGLAFLFGPLKRRWLMTAICSIALLAPFIIDGQLRHHYDMPNNAWIGLHGMSHFEGDPNLYWNEAVADFNEKEPSKPEVLKDYAGFVFSKPGFDTLYGYFNTLLGYETYHYRKPGVLWGYGFFFAAVLLLALSRWLPVSLRAGSKMGWIKRIPWLLMLIVGAAIYGLRVLPEAYTITTWVGLLGIVGIYAFWKKHWLSLFLVLVYFGGLALLIALGNIGDHRVFATFQWCSLLAPAAVISEALFRRGRWGTEVLSRAGIAIGALLAIAFIVFLYGGTSWLPKRFSEDTIKKVGSGDYLIKVSDSPRIQRSFFWKPGRTAHFDDSFGKPGDLFATESFPDIRYNGSYMNPNHYRPSNNHEE